MRVKIGNSDSIQQYHQLAISIGPSKEVAETSGDVKAFARFIASNFIKRHASGKSSKHNDLSVVNMTDIVGMPCFVSAKRKNGEWVIESVSSDPPALVELNESRGPVKLYTGDDESNPLDATSPEPVQPMQQTAGHAQTGASQTMTAPQPARERLPTAPTLVVWQEPVEPNDPASGYKEEIHTKEIPFAESEPLVLSLLMKGCKVSVWHEKKQPRIKVDLG